MFLPGLPPPFTFTGDPVFPNPFAPEGALTATGRGTGTETDRGAESRQALSVLRPLLEPLLRRRGVAWTDAVPTLNKGDQASALDLALRGADADATSQALEELLAAVGSGTAPADAIADGSGYEEVYHATVAKAAATDGSGTDRETTPETAPELLRSQKRKLKDAEEERRRSKRRITEPADLTLPTAGLAGSGEETIGRAAMMEALQQSASPPVVGLPVKSETAAPPVVPIALPPDGSAGGDALAAAAAAAEELDAQAEREKRKLPPEQLPVVEQPLTPIISSQLKTLVVDLVARGLPGVTETGQATGIFDIDLGEAVPHYREIVAEPMDLGTMKRKVERGAYATVGDFEGDFRKLIIACNQYNLRDPSHPGYRDGQYYLKLAGVLEAQFEKRWEKFLDDVADQQAAAAAKAKKKHSRSSSAGGGGVKIALGGAQVGGGAGGKQSRPAHLRNAAYWRGDEGVARAVRARVEAEQAEGKELGGAGAGDGGRGGRGGARPSTRDILLANRHRESEAAAAAAVGGGAAKSTAAASAAAGPGTVAAGAAASAAGGGAGGGGAPGDG